MAIQDFYNSTVEIQQRTVTTNPMGGSTTTYSTRIASLKCRITRKTIREVDEFGKMTTRAIWRLYCDADTDGLSIVPTDRVVMSNETTLQIKTIYNPGELNRHLEIDCLELD